MRVLERHWREAIKDIGIITITEKREDIRLNNWLTFDNAELNDYLNRDLEITEKGQVKSTTTNLVAVLVNPCFCKERAILSEHIFFDTCSMTIQFYGWLRGEKSSDLEIRKWNDNMTNILGVEIESVVIKYSCNSSD